jgi:hypothetical protein
MNMILLFMHYIALCTSCIAHFNLGHLYTYSITQRRNPIFKRSKSNGCSEIHKRQVARMLILLLSRQAPMHLTTVLEFCYLYILIMILACALGYNSWIDTLVALRLLSYLSLLIIWLEIGH